MDRTELVKRVVLEGSKNDAAIARDRIQFQLERSIDHDAKLWEQFLRDHRRAYNELQIR